LVLRPYQVENIYSFTHSYAKKEAFVLLSQSTIGLGKIHHGTVDLAVQEARVRTKDNRRETKQNSQHRGRVTAASDTDVRFDRSCGPFQLGENLVDVVTTVGVGGKVLGCGQASLAFGGHLVALFAQLAQLVLLFVLVAVLIVVVWWERNGNKVLLWRERGTYVEANADTRWAKS
jgi:hypothetical protein